MSNDYRSKYAGEIEQLWKKLADRASFAYSAAGDPAYRQYESAYRKLGSDAMQDTMGQAAELTGGYGSSYSTRAGREAYARQLSALAELVPELESSARKNWEAENDSLHTLLSQLQSLEDEDYKRWLNAYKTAASSASGGRKSSASGTAAKTGTAGSYSLTDSLTGLALLSLLNDPALQLTAKKTSGNTGKK